jgi:hypothetical protein
MPVKKKVDSQPPPPPSAAGLLATIPPVQSNGENAVAIHRDRLSDVVRDVPDRDRAPEPYDPHAALTKALGARFWATDKVFDWARRQTGERLRFTRYYFRQFGLDRHVLVDIFAAVNAATEKEIALKQQAIRAENERRASSKSAQPLIGYLPTIRGAFIPEETIEAVKRGEVLDLIDRARHEGVIS